MDFWLSSSRSLGVCAVFLPLIVISAEAAQRGISVALRQSESINAPILEDRERWQESYALVIGIRGCSNGWPKLINAIRDDEISDATLGRWLVTIDGKDPQIFG